MDKSISNLFIISGLMALLIFCGSQEIYAWCPTDMPALRNLTKQLLAIDHRQMALLDGGDYLKKTISLSEVESLINIYIPIDEPIALEKRKALFESINSQSYTHQKINGKHDYSYENYIELTVLQEIKKAMYKKRLVLLFCEPYQTNG